MTAQTPPNRKEKGFFALVENYGGSITVVIGALFLIGYFLNCYYFSEFGVFELTAVRVQHIFTGLIFLIFLAWPACLIALPFVLSKRICNSAGKMGRIGVFSSFFIGLLIILTLVLQAITNLDSQWGWCWIPIYILGKNHLNSDGPGLLRFCWVMWIILFHVPIVEIVCRSNLKIKFKIPNAVCVSFLTAGLFCGGYYYAVAVNPLMEATYGGGHYGTYRVHLKKDTRASGGGPKKEQGDLSPKDDDGSLPPWIVAKDSNAKAGIVYMNEKSVFICPPEELENGYPKEVWEFSRDQIVSIAYFEDDNK